MLRLVTLLLCVRFGAFYRVIGTQTRGVHARHRRAGKRALNLVLGAHPEHVGARSLEQGAQRPHRVIFIRHGESEWNAANRFIGWKDVPLTERGEHEARRAAEALTKYGLADQIDLMLCSYLKRSIKTSWIMADTIGRPWMPVRPDWRLNEQMYGALQGRGKRDVTKEHGAEQVMKWRRSYYTAPPPALDAVGYFPANDQKYASMTDDDIPESWCGSPQTESLKDTQARAWSMWREKVAPELRSGKTVAIVAHGNVIRALLKRLDNISVEALRTVSIPRAVPLVYDLNARLEPVRSLHSLGVLRGRFLGSPVRIAAALRAESPEAQLGVVVPSEYQGRSASSNPSHVSSHSPSSSSGASHSHISGPSSGSSSNPGANGFGAVGASVSGVSEFATAPSALSVEPGHAPA